MRKFYYGLLLCSLFAFSAKPGYSQRLEAETATLSGGAAKQVCATCSGSSMVAQGEGSLSFAATIAKEGFYNLVIHVASPGGEKFNNLEIAGNTLTFKVAHNAQYTTIPLIHAQKFAAGPLSIKITKSWGWLNIDYIELVAVEATSRFNLNQTLVTPNPTPQAKALYDFLLDNYGDKLISGVMTLNSMDEVNWLKQNTGKEPALVGLDLMHTNRGYTWYNEKEPLNDAKAYYTRNGIPALTWHWRDPSRLTEEFYVKSTDKPNGTSFDISKVSDVNSPEYKAMLADIDYTAGLLKELQAQNVPVIWRPLHEAAGGWFWWGAKGGQPLKTLWRLMYNRMVNHHGLKNLIWVWTREPGDEAWYPGDEYVDIVGRDIYKDGDHSSHALEFGSMNYLYGGKKMVTLSEVGSFPDVDNLIKDGAGWSWFMPWYGGYTRDSKYNSLDLWKKTMNHTYVITLDEMPTLSTYVRQDTATTVTAIEEISENQGLVAYPTLITEDLHLKDQSLIKKIEIYNLTGTCVKIQAVHQTETVVSFNDLKSGFYIVVVNGIKTIKVFKQ